MAGESLDKESPPQQTPEIITQLSLVTLQGDPSFYRKKLMTLVNELPPSQPVSEVQAEETKNLLRFCLNPDNLDPAEESLVRILDGRALSPDTEQALQIIRAWSPIKRVPEAEKALRTRLLVWVDYLDSLMSPPSATQPANT